MSLSTRTKVTISVALKRYEAYAIERSNQEQSNSIRPGYWTRRLNRVQEAIAEFERKGGDE